MQTNQYPQGNQPAQVPPQPSQGNQPAPPQQPTPPTSKSGLAIAGLVLGIIAAATSFMPFINNISFFIALIGFVLAIVGFVQVRKNKKAGMGIAIAALVLNIVACVIVLASQSYYGSVIDDALSTSGAVVSSEATSTTTESASSASSESSSSAPAAANSSKPESSSTTSTVDMPLGTIADVGGGLQVTVNSVTPGLTNYDGTEIVAVNVTYVNNGNRTESFNVYDWKAESDQGVQTSQTYYSEAQDELRSGSLASGGTITGNLYFDPVVAKVIYYKTIFSNQSDISWVVS